MTNFNLRKIVTGTTASEIAEAAIVLPIFFLVLLGIYWFGRAFNTYATINHAAREGARIAVAQTCATCGASPNSAPTPAAVASTVTQTMQASSVDPTQIIQYPATPTPANCPAPLPTAACSAPQNVTVCT